MADLNARRHRRTDRGQFLFDLPIDLVLSKLRRDANRILDGIRIGRPMSDEAHAFHSQQRRAAVLSVVEAFFEVGKGATRK